MSDDASLTEMLARLAAAHWGVSIEYRRGGAWELSGPWRCRLIGPDEGDEWARTHNRHTDAAVIGYGRTPEAAVADAEQKMPAARMAARTRCLAAQAKWADRRS